MVDGEVIHKHVYALRLAPQYIYAVIAHCLEIHTLFLLQYVPSIWTIISECLSRLSLCDKI